MLSVSIGARVRVANNRRVAPVSDVAGTQVRPSSAAAPTALCRASGCRALYQLGGLLVLAEPPGAPHPAR